MKLHRLVLTNYRGITHREVEFPDHGVVVVSGANEIGKSSMIEALDLL
ncbi:MAG: Conserved hydrolase, partial [Mycobacterium sp.]|nr:Conserved hydrolase [Mycobacterium sp.]